MIECSGAVCRRKIEFQRLSWGEGIYCLQWCAIRRNRKNEGLSLSERLSCGLRGFNLVARSDPDLTHGVLRLRQHCVGVNLFSGSDSS